MNSDEILKGAHIWIRDASGLDESAPYRFDYYAQQIDILKDQLEHQIYEVERLNDQYFWSRDD